MRTAPMLFARMLLIVGLLTCGYGCADDPQVSQCPASLGCDDGRSCTVDSCNPEGTACSWDLMPDTCLIMGVCYAEGDVSPSNPCQICQPALSARDWTPRPDGTTCVEGNQCVENSQCQAGLCDAPLKACDDNNQCTDDNCDPEVGCSYKALPQGTVCEDGDLCTSGEMCQDGTCTEPTADCDDGNICTSDVCDSLTGCTNTANTDLCDDGDPCTEEGLCSDGVCTAGESLSCDDENSCTIDTCDALAGCHHLPNSGASCDDGDPCTAADTCVAGVCDGGSATTCDDDNDCTTDQCVPGEGCSASPVTDDPCCAEGLSICDDGDPCTLDICAPDSLECTHLAGDGSCDDGDACTAEDVCEDGSCAGLAVACEDANPCTLDSCDPATGCEYENENGTLCDDGMECSTDDVCTEGSCMGSYAECLCVPDFHDDAVKCNSVALAPDDATGFDLTGDGVADNALSAVAGLVNTSIFDALVEGDLMLLFEFRGPLSGASTIAAYQSILAQQNEGCDYQKDTCTYAVKTNSLVVVDGVCSPLVSMPVTIEDNKLLGGGPGTNFPFQIPLGEAILDIELKDVMVSAELFTENGETIALSGMIGGAVLEADLVAALEQLPDDALGDAFTPGQVIGLLSLLVDIDTDGDGTNDAVSAAILLEAIDAKILGYE